MLARIKTLAINLVSKMLESAKLPWNSAKHSRPCNFACALCSTYKKNTHLPDYNSTCKNKPSSANSDELRKIELIKREYERKKLVSKNCPSLTDENIKELLLQPTWSQRARYMSYLIKREIDKENSRIKKEHRKTKVLINLKARAQKQASEHIPYGLGHNSILIQIRRPSMGLLDRYNLAYSVQFGQNIVFDMGYDEFMKKKEARNAATQIKYCYRYNRGQREPFHINLCNTDQEKLTYLELSKMLPSFHKYANITEKSYLDVFPREKLVYLTPHANNELLEYDHDAVYIIGAFVDLSIPEPISFTKAKCEGIKTAKLPLDRYLEWGPSSGKRLTIDQMLKIMLCMKETRSWEEALQFVPRRKLKKKMIQPH